jgi:hypothetical protein
MFKLGNCIFGANAGISFSFMGVVCFLLVAFSTICGKGRLKNEGDGLEADL